MASGKERKSALGIPCFGMRMVYRFSRLMSDAQGTFDGETIAILCPVANRPIGPKRNPVRHHYAERMNSLEHRRGKSRHG